MDVSNPAKRDMLRGMREVWVSPLSSEHVHPSGRELMQVGFLIPGLLLP